MEDVEVVLLKAEIDEISKRIADTMKNLETLEYFQQDNPTEKQDQ